MRIAWITVLYKTPKGEVTRLKSEIKKLGLNNYRYYFVDNTKTKQGYGVGVNKGIKKALSDKEDIYIITNPDISFKNIKPKDIYQGLKKYDILGFAIKQADNIYYGGEIDRWRMSGGLISKKPITRYAQTDFVSGSLMIIKKEVFDRIGLFDENYFMYYEDVDFCYRAKKAGFKVGIDSKNYYDHYEISKNWNDKDHWLKKSRSRFFNKYSSWKQKIYENLYRWRSLVRK